MIGVGRSEFEKTYDGFANSVFYASHQAPKLCRSLFLLSLAIALKTLKFTDQTRTNYFTSRLAYVTQILVARKINEALSVQLTPSYLHRNLVATELDPNDIYALGAGARLKLSKRISLNGEYYYIANPKNMSACLDIKTERQGIIDLLAHIGFSDLQCSNILHSGLFFLRASILPRRLRHKYHSDRALWLPDYDEDTTE